VTDQPAGLAADQPINHHTLADFRMSQKERLDALFAEILGALQSVDRVDRQTLLPDGTKVRAQASKESLHRRKTLEEHCRGAQQALAQLEQGGPADGPSGAGVPTSPGGSVAVPRTRPSKTASSHLKCVA